MQKSFLLLSWSWVGCRWRILHYESRRTIRQRTSKNFSWLARTAARGLLCFECAASGVYIVWSGLGCGTARSWGESSRTGKRGGRRDPSFIPRLGTNVIITQPIYMPVIACLWCVFCKQFYHRFREKPMQSSHLCNPLFQKIPSYRQNSNLIKSKSFILLKFQILLEYTPPWYALGCTSKVVVCNFCAHF